MWNVGWIYLNGKSIYFGNVQKKVKNALTSYFSQQESTSVIQHKLIVSPSRKSGTKYDGIDTDGLAVVTVAASSFPSNSKG